MITITTADAIIHTLESPEAIADIPSPNTRAALQAAYDAGHWELYEPPQAEPEPLPPDWPAFRLALLQSASFRLWSEALPATWREDLKLAAIAANAEALQSIYTHCTTLHSPGHTAATEWQQVADHHRIPITF
ncbi:hypothetical protein PGN35_025300 [Nodosilinea sp. PGN35]|uniref:hypothetical protein n=1 Tax=Nodosilinea sp. PGN35 TaxID=3020489 RepID=UPI0023B2571B|nr:hypothetical protein [Nodosilinea sp. TSF1-S3]MDF0367448.1 hypothetical protein [Nodosilinea sp. TSF1-S3]